MHTKNIITAGRPLAAGNKVLIMVHGRGAGAADILSLSEHLSVANYSLVAPQATNNTWYPFSFMAPLQQNEPWLSSALEIMGETVVDIEAAGVATDQIYILGFSQGACLTLEYVTRNARQYGGVVAFTGGLIGDRIYPEHYSGSFKQTPVFIGTSDPDMHVPVGRVLETEAILKSMDANVTVKVYPKMGHTISQDEIDLANKLVFK